MTAPAYPRVLLAHPCLPGSSVHALDQSGARACLRARVCARVRVCVCSHSSDADRRVPCAAPPTFRLSAGLRRSRTRRTEAVCRAPPTPAPPAGMTSPCDNRPEGAAVTAGISSAQSQTEQSCRALGLRTLALPHLTPPPPPWNDGVVNRARAVAAQQAKPKASVPHRPADRPEPAAGI